MSDVVRTCECGAELESEETLCPSCKRARNYLPSMVSRTVVTLVTNAPAWKMARHLRRKLNEALSVRDGRISLVSRMGSRRE